MPTDEHISLPRTLLHFINRLTYGDNLEEKIRISLVIRLFVDKTVTLEQAAELAGKSVVAFIEILHGHHVPGIEYKIKQLVKKENLKLPKNNVHRSKKEH